MGMGHLWRCDENVLELDCGDSCTTSQVYQKTVHFEMVTFMVCALYLNKEHVKHLLSKMKWEQKTQVAKLTTDTCQKIPPKHLACHLCPKPSFSPAGLLQALVRSPSSCSPVKCWHPGAPSCTISSSHSTHSPWARSSPSVMSASQAPKFLSSFHLYHSKRHHQPPIHESKSQRVSLGTSQPLLPCLLAHSLPIAGSGFLQAERACKQEGGREPNCTYITPSPHLTHSLFILQKPGWFSERHI